MMPPCRGFPKAEFQARTALAQAAMQQAELSALLLTTEAELRYYTGFLTRFWESPTRPWFLVLPVQGTPIAVIPAIGHHLMAQSWLDDIRCWDAPDYTDDGIGLLAETVRSVVPKGGRVGVADQMESHLRMPLQSYQQLRDALPDRVFCGDRAITRTLRMVKSDREIAKIAYAAQIADRAFARVHEIAGAGVPLSEVFRRFQILCLEEGADWVPYLAGAAGQGGYGDVISPATDTPLENGDVLMLDTGLVWDGYYCDFDRNFSIGPPSGDVQSAHARLIDATEAGLHAARPGKRMCDLFAEMEKVTRSGAGGGRLGHGLGLQLTEWPSIIAEDLTEVLPGMVLTLEPCVSLSGARIMVHEENITITENGAVLLSSQQTREMTVI